ncbi:MAG: NAD(P)H-hydrate dehydratase [Fulvimarina manganoxydans]|uniref:NAD(P)H-hydrate dehydratase n=1 Tax=Fulvimarina manganoxydans TaxID=937218 RepID=UPI002353A526|nr:NAD(P)H-hydrate dehydratase [Fulvimarina manganoxydans]MCK5933194.1 NAD(P)H-hydrate dehydratase [Fulvimarina manganoxydans]
MPTCAPIGTVLLAPMEMAEADRLTIESGISGWQLMSAAGRAVAGVAAEMIALPGPVACLAGPGNNGGDAYVAAANLREQGFAVRVFALGDPERLAGDAALARAAWNAEIKPLSAFEADQFSLIIDGLFGAGLSRALDGKVANCVERANACRTPILSIDLPSGVAGDSGAVLGTAFRASRTISFFRAKPGHRLEPGRSLCGEITIRPIGILPDVLQTIRPRTFDNDPNLWGRVLQWPADAGHKYDRGHAVILSGGASKTGAARLAANAALRAGAGLVTVFSPASAVLVHAAHLTAVMIKRCEGTSELDAYLADERLNAFVLGPGFGVGAEARDAARLILEKGRALVLDADGITSYSDDPRALFALAREAGKKASETRLVMTPHAGEFKRLFPDLASSKGSKLEQAREAAARAHSILVLKGRDTVIAEPGGRAAINSTGTPWLATAGTGDVLTGMIVAQLAQGTPAFEAACAGVWMHGKAAEAFGPGLIAEDLAPMLPKVFSDLARLTGET